MQKIGLEAILDLANFQDGTKAYLDGLNEMNSQTDSFAGAIASGLGGVADTLLNIGKVAATAIAGAGLAAGVGLTTMFATSTDAAASLEEGLSQVNAVLGLTGDLTAEQIAQQAQLKDLAIGLSIDPGLKVNAEEAAQVFEILGRNGIEAQEILDGAAQATILLANAVKTDFNTAGDVASSTMLVFGKSAAELGEVIDQITGVTVASKFTIEDYALALSQGGGVAATVGVEFEDFNTTIAAISPLFASGSDAGTSFKVFLQRLIPQSTKAAAAMRDLGLFTGQTDKEFEKTQQSIAKIDDQIAKLDPTAKNYTERVAELSEKKQELTAQLNKGQNAFFNTDGSMKSMAEITQILHDATAGLTEEQKLNALSTIFGTDAMRAAAGVAGLTAAEFETLKQEILGVSATDMAAEQMNNLNAALSTLGDTFRGLQIKLGDQFLQPLAEAVRAVTKLLGDNVDDIVTFFQPLIDFLIKQINRIPEIISVIGPMVDQTFAPIRELFFVQIPDAIDYFIGTFLDGFKEGISLTDGFFKGLENILSQPLGIQPDFIEIPIRLISQTILFLRKAIPQIITFFGPLITFVTETLPKAIATVADSFFTGFAEGETLISSILSGLGGLLKNLFPAETVDPFIDALTRLVDFIGGRATSAIKNLGTAVSNSLGQALDFIGTKVLPFLTKSINTFLDTGEIPIFDELAQSLKEFDLAGLISSVFGEVDWANLIPGLDFSGLFTDLSELDLSGLATTFTQVSGSIMNFLDNVVAPVLEKLPFFSQLFGDAEGEISGFGTVLATLAAGAGGFAVVDILTKIAGAAFTLLSPLAALATTGAGIATIMGALGISLSGILLPLLAVSAVVGLVAVAWINDWGGIREIVANVLGFVMTIAGGIVDFFITQWPAISEAVAFLGTVFGALGEAIGAVVSDVLIPLITDTFGQLTGILNDLGLTWGDVFAALMQATVIVIGVIVGAIALVIGVIAGLVSAIAAAVNTAVVWWRALANAVVQTFTGIVGIIAGFGFALGALLSGDINGFIEGVKVGFQGILDFFGGIWNTLTTLVSAPFAILTSLVGGFIEGIIAYFTTLYNALVGNSIIPDLITAIVAYFTGLGPQLIAAVAMAIAAIVSAFANGLTLIIGAVSALLAGIVALFTGLIASIQGVFGAAVGVWVEIGSSIISGLIDGFTGMVDSFLSGVQDFVSSVLDALEGLTGFQLPSWIREMPRALDAIRRAISSTIGFIRDLVQEIQELGNMELPDWMQLGSPPELAIALDMITEAGGGLPDLAQPFHDLNRANPNVESLKAMAEALGVVGLSAEDASASISSFQQQDITIPFEIDVAGVSTAITSLQNLMATGLSAKEAFAQLPGGLQDALRVATATGPQLNDALVTPFGAARTEVTALFTDLRGMVATPITPNIQPADTSGLDASRQAFSDYVNAVIDDGDYLNDWLTHLPEGIRSSTQSLGQSIAEIQTQFAGLGGEELVQAQAAFDNYINAVLTSGDTLNEFLGQLPLATQASAQQIGEVVANLNTQLQTTAPTTAITPTVDQAAVAQTTATVQTLGATINQSLGQGSQAAVQFQTSMAAALGAESLAGTPAALGLVTSSVDTMSISMTEGQAQAAALGTSVTGAQAAAAAFTAALGTLPPTLELVGSGFGTLGEQAGQVGEITSNMADQISSGLQRSVEATHELIAAFDALIVKSQETQASLPDGVMPGSPPPLAVGLMKVSAAAKSLPDMASQFNAINPNVAAVNEYASALAKANQQKVSLDFGSVKASPVQVQTTPMLDNLAKVNGSKISKATNLNTIGASKVPTTKSVTVNLQQTNQFDGRVPDEKLVNSIRDETRTLIRDAFDGQV